MKKLFITFVLMLCIQLLYAQQFSVNSFFLAETDLTANTPGKRSPDGQLLEYAYTRELARQIVAILKSRGYDSEPLVPEDDDIPLSERVRRTNVHCQALGKSNVILISLHLNAAGDGTKWLTLVSG